MKKQYFIATLILITSFSTNLFSQNESGGLFENFGVAVKAGLYGGGLDISTSLHPNIKVRVGFNYMAYDLPSGLTRNVEGLDTGNKITVKAEKAGFRFSNANLLLDFFPMPSGIFHLTTGLYFGQSEIHASGTAPERFAVDDYEITPKNGEFDAKVKLGGSVKPYVGFGLGRTIPKNHVGFKFELGVVYQGNFKIESDNVDTSGLQSGAQSEIDKLELPTILTQIWPMVTFSLTFRIK